MDFSEQAKAWDDKPGRRERAAAIAASIRAVLPLERVMSAIELGGGTGLLSRALADRLGPVSVTDVAPGMVEVARALLADARMPGWSAWSYDVERDPLPSARFDLVLSQLAWHHLIDPAAALRTAWELLTPGGYLALVDLDLDPEGYFHAESHPEFQGPHGFDRDQIRAWLTEAGFVDVRLDLAFLERKIVAGVVRDLPLFLATGRRPGDRQCATLAEGLRRSPYP